MTPEDTPFTLRHIEEPEIQFEGGTETSPKRGLIRYGPRLYEEGHHTNQTRDYRRSRFDPPVPNYFTIWRSGSIQEQVIIRGKFRIPA